MNSLCL